MTLTVELTPELEAAVREAAAREGVPPEKYVVEALKDRVQRTAVPVVSGDEATLLRQLAEGLPAATWERYRELLEKRQAETLTPEEHTSLITLSDEIEAWNARRLSVAVELARLRNVPLFQLMQQLGLTAQPDV